MTRILPGAVLPPRPSDIRAGAPLAVFLDLDGTLLELAPRPDDVVVPRTLPGLLANVSQRLQGALAIVSGRRIAALDELLFPYQGAAAGLHGAELRAVPWAAVTETIRATPPQDVLAHVDALHNPGHDLLIEDKGVCVAIHHRLLGAALHDLRTTLNTAIARHGPDLDLLEGRNVLEIKPRSIDKGAACRHLMAAPAFSGRRPVVLGDDITDIPAFHYASSAGGIAIAVGSRVCEHAAYRLPGPGDVLAWLQGMVD